MIICKDCKIELTDNNRFASSKKNNSKMCKKCLSLRSVKWKTENKEKTRGYRRKWVLGKRGKKITRAWHIKRKFNLSEEEYCSKLIEQDNKCEICKKVFEKTPCVDHNHDTKEVRGLLCRNCNNLIGFSEESESILREAIVYIKKYNLNIDVEV